MLLHLCTWLWSMYTRVVLVTPCTCARGTAQLVTVHHQHKNRQIWRSRHLSEPKVQHIIEKLASLCFELHGKAQMHRKYFTFTYGHHPIRPCAFCSCAHACCSTWGYRNVLYSSIVSTSVFPLWFQLFVIKEGMKHNCAKPLVQLTYIVIMTKPENELEKWVVIIIIISSVRPSYSMAGNHCQHDLAI